MKGVYVTESAKWARFFDHEPSWDEVAEAIAKDRPKVLATLIAIRSPSGEEGYRFSEDVLQEYGLWGRKRTSRVTPP